VPLSSPSVGPFDLHEIVESAVAKLLPSVVQTALPDVLTRVLAVPTTSSQPTSSPNPISPLHKLILTHLTDHAQELAKQVTTDTLEHATDLRNTADIELQEQLEDHRLEFAVLKEDGLMEMHRLCDAKLEELDVRTTQLIESVEQESADTYTETRQKLDELVGEQRMKLVKELLRLDSELRRRRGESAEERGQRARSVPLEAGW
jgi:hypothetical protein